MTCSEGEQYVTVWLRGGPWDGFEVPGVFGRVEIYEAPREELGAFMPQPGAPDASHRAAYEPATEGDPAVWRFVGWQ